MDNLFTVGNNTNHGEIKSFEIIGNDMYANCSRGKFNIKELTVLPTPTEQVVEKQIMFTTEDGKPIPQCYEGEIWRVFTEPSSFASWVPVELGMPQYLNQGEKYFSTKEAAEQYILENRPCLSLNDVMEIVRELGNNTNGRHNKSYINTELHKKIKQKLKHQ